MKDALQRLFAYRMSREKIVPRLAKFAANLRAFRTQYPRQWRDIGPLEEMGVGMPRAKPS